jgi:hypothetical protein
MTKSMVLVQFWIIKIRFVCIKEADFLHNLANIFPSFEYIEGRRLVVNIILYVAFYPFIKNSGCGQI